MSENKICDLYLNGKTIKEISELTNITKYHIKKILNKNNIKKTNNRYKSLVGQKFGKLTVVELLINNKKSRSWKCFCDCGSKKAVYPTTTRLIKGYTISCGCIGPEKVYRGIDILSKTYWSIILTGARNRNLPVEISMEDALNLFYSQNGKCAISGVEILLTKSYGNGSEQTASLDRIDSSKGYTKDNIQWVHKRVNIMKMDMTDKEFIHWCKLIYLNDINNPENIIDIPV